MGKEEREIKIVITFKNCFTTMSLLRNSFFYNNDVNVMIGFINIELQVLQPFLGCRLSKSCVILQIWREPQKLQTPK